MGRTTKLGLMGLFSGMAQGYGRRAREERAKIEKEKEDAKGFTEKEKAQFGIYESIFKNPDAPMPARQDAYRKINSMAGIDLPEDNPETAIDESGAFSVIEPMMKREGEARADQKADRQLKTDEIQLRRDDLEFKRTQLPMQKLLLDIQLANAKSQGNADKQREERIKLDYKKLDETEKQNVIDNMLSQINDWEERQRHFEKETIGGKVIIDTDDPRYKDLANKISNYQQQIESLLPQQKGKKLVGGFGTNRLPRTGTK